MLTIEDVKQDLVEHVANIDKSKMSMLELKSYVDVVAAIDSMYKPNYMDTIMSAMNGNTFNWYSSLPQKENEFEKKENV